jgi:copper transport protein
MRGYDHPRGRLASPAEKETTMTRIAAIVALLTAGAFACIAFAQTTHGHAEYDYSTPADGAVLTSSPSRVDAYFTQVIVRQPSVSSLNVVNEQGADVDNNDTTFDTVEPLHMSITLQPDLPSGTYTVQWATASAEDGDEASGTFSFTVELPGEPTEPAPTEPRDDNGGATEAPAATVVAVPATGGGPNAAATAFEIVLAMALATASVCLFGLGIGLRLRRHW